MARAKRDRKQRFAQLRAAFVLTKRNDRRLVPLVLATLLGVFLFFVAIGLLIEHPFYLGFLGLLFGLMAATIVFGRRAAASAFRQVEGQPGAAAAVLQSMRGDWRVSPGIAVTGQQDFVHRVVGRPGVILVAEGAPHRVRSLLGQEKKRIGRVVGDTPVYDVVVGDGPDQVPLKKLQAYFTKLPRNIKGAEVNTLERRLSAIGGLRVPLPKGPMPAAARMPSSRRISRGRR